MPKKLKRGSKHKYSTAFRAKVCFEVISGKLTVYEARREYGISYTSSIYRWLEEFKKMPPEAILQVMNADKPTAPGEGEQPTALDHQKVAAIRADDGIVYIKADENLHEQQ